MSPDDLTSVLGVPDLAARLEAVQARIGTTLDPYRASLPEGAVEVITAPGKRLRASLVIAFAGLGTSNDDAVLRAATAVELVQIGSLIHDDLIDGSPLRRGRPTVHQLAGPGAALVTGDLVLALAGELVAALGSFPSSVLAQGMAQMARGELVELLDQGKVERSMARYRVSIEGKTGALFAAACRLGAWCGNLPVQVQGAASTYGLAVGTAYQLVDDLVDVAGSGEVGKPLGADLASGIYTAPVLLALQHRGKGRLRRALFGGHPADLEEALTLVRSSSGDARGRRGHRRGPARRGDGGGRSRARSPIAAGLRAFPRALALGTLRAAGVTAELSRRRSVASSSCSRSARRLSRSSACSSSTARISSIRRRVVGSLSPSQRMISL